MSIMNGKEMMAVCEEKGLLVPHDDIPIIGLDGTVVKDTTVNYPTIFAIIVGRPTAVQVPRYMCMYGTAVRS